MAGQKKLTKRLAHMMKGRCIPFVKFRQTMKKHITKVLALDEDFYDSNEGKFLLYFFVRLFEMLQIIQHSVGVRPTHTDVLTGIAYDLAFFLVHNKQTSVINWYQQAFRSLTGTAGKRRKIT